MLQTSGRAPQDQRKIDNFVGRREELNALLAATLQIKAEGARVLSVLGEGGQGKSRLLHRFTQVLCREEAFSHVRCSLVDLGLRLDREEWAPLVWIRNALAVQGVQFPRFDLGFQLFWSAAPAQPPPDLKHTWLQEAPCSAVSSVDDIDSQCSDWLETPIPDPTPLQVPFIRWALAKARRTLAEEELADRLMSTKASVSVLFAGKFGERLRRRPELLRALPLLFAEDLSDHIRRNPEDRFVLIFDAYEQLAKGRPAPALRSMCPAERTIEAIIREVSGTLIVVSGRERFNWRRTRNAGKSFNIIRVELDGLSGKEGEALLRKEGIGDPAVAEAILAASKTGDGPDEQKRILPILIHVMVERWRTRRDQGAPLEPEDLEVSASDSGGRFREQLDQLLRDHGRPTLKALQRLSLCSWFDEEIFGSLNRELPTETKCTTWCEIVGLSYVSAGNIPKTFIIHDFARSAISAEVHAKRAREIHEAMILHLTERISSYPIATDPRINLLLDQALEHSLQLGARGVLDRGGVWFAQIAKAKRYDLLARLAAVAHRVCAEEAGEHDVATLLMFGLWAAARNRGGYPEEVRLAAEDVWSAMLKLNRSTEEAGLIVGQCLAGACSALGLEVEAESVRRVALAKCTATLGREHPETLASAYWLAKSLWLLGEHVTAEELGRRTLEARGRVLGQEHPETLSSAVQLAYYLLRTLGRCEEAEQINRDALAIATGALGPEHELTVAASTGLAVSLVSLRRYNEAAELFRELLISAVRRHGACDRRTVSSLSSLIEAFCLDSQHVEAEGLCRRTVGIQSSMFGADHPDTLRSAKRWAKCLEALGRRDESRAIQMRVQALTARLHAAL